MTTPDRATRDESPSRLWKRNGAIWAALLGLLMLSFGAAYIPLGAWNTWIGLLVAATKTALVAVLFMELGKASALVRLAAAAGLFFVFVMFSLTLAEVTARVLMGWRS